MVRLRARADFDRFRHLRGDDDAAEGFCRGAGHLLCFCFVLGRGLDWIGVEWIELEWIGLDEGAFDESLLPPEGEGGEFREAR